MANTTLKFGNGNCAIKEDSALAYSDQYDNFKPLPFDFSRASNATVVNKAGLIETVGNGIPRIDFLGNTQGALLLEPQRTNAITNSSEFGSTGWGFVTTGTALAPIVTDDYAISPDGTQNAQRIQFNLGGGTSISDRTVIRQNIGSQTGWFLSVWMKSTNGEEQEVLWHTNSDSNATTITGEWQRFTFSRNGVNNSWAGLGLRGSNSTVNTADILVYGFQVEQGSYATSYIPTYGATSTRLADSCTNGANEQVINSTEGTLYVEANLIDGYNSNNFLATIFDNSNGNGNHIFIQRYLGNIQAKIRVGTTQAEITESNTTPGSKKIAFTYKANEFKMFVNGSQVGSTDTSGSVFSANTLDKINVGSYYNDTLKFNSVINDVKLYNTSLTDSELAALTTI